MLLRQNRLKSKKDFETVFKKGESFKSGFILLKVAPNSLDMCRFGIVVSQKVSKKAVVRNKIRRRLSEIIRLNFMQAQKSADIAVVGLPGLQNKNFTDTKEMLVTVLKKAGLTAGISK